MTLPKTDGAASELRTAIIATALSLLAVRMTGVASSFDLRRVGRFFEPHSQGRQIERRIIMAIDPICGMTVDEASARSAERGVKWTPVFGPAGKVHGSGLDLKSREGLSWQFKERVHATSPSKI